MAIELISPAAAFALERHKGQTYGKSKPYHVHLFDGVGVLRRFVDWEALPQEFVDAAWLHDVVEDTPTTLNEVEAAFGPRVAELVNAVTNEPGPNRKERHAKTYPKVISTDGAIIVKLADRIANVEQSVSYDRYGRPPQNLFWMYVKEWDEFQRMLRGKCRGEGLTGMTMWSYLVELMDEGHEKARALKDAKAFRGEV